MLLLVHGYAFCQVQNLTQQVITNYVCNDVACIKQQAIQVSNDSVLYTLKITPLNLSPETYEVLGNVVFTLSSFNSWAGVQKIGYQFQDSLGLILPTYIGGDFLTIQTNFNIQVSEPQKWRTRVTYYGIHLPDIRVYNQPYFRRSVIRCYTRTYRGYYPIFNNNLYESNGINKNVKFETIDDLIKKLAIGY
jgi:hypothetical protein